MTMEQAPRFGGYPVNPEIVPRLEKVLHGLSWLEKRRLKACVLQGWAPSSHWSRDTHATGHAVDFDTAKWSADFIRKVVSLLQGAGFEVVLRLRGENIGTALPVSREHLHAVLIGHGNSYTLSQVTRAGGHRHIEVELRKRGEA